MTCNECRWKTERGDCPWNFDYENTDYAEDCIDFRNINSPESAFIRKEETKMTKEQWTELMNDNKLPWPVIIDDVLKQTFTDKVADEVFDQILNEAWYRHLSLGHFKGKDFSIAQAASEVIDETDTENYIILVEKKEGRAMEAIMKGKPVNLKAMFAAGIVDFIRELTKESGENPTECFMDFASSLFTGCLVVLSKDKDKGKEDDDD